MIVIRWGSRAKFSLLQYIIFNVTINFIYINFIILILQNL